MFLNNFYFCYFICFLPLYLLMTYISIICLLYVFGNTTFWDLTSYKLYQHCFVTQIQLGLEGSLDKMELESARKFIQHKKVIFATLARNIAPFFKKTKFKMTTIGNLFSDYRILVFENDSKDKSRELLQAWSKLDSKVILLDCCDQKQCDCKLKEIHPHKFGITSSKRIHVMKTYRQKLLHYAKTHFINSFDYYIVFDFDLPGAIYMDGFLSNFITQSHPWDMVFARGLHAMPIPFSNQLFVYDGLAFIGKNDSFHYKDSPLKEVIHFNQEVNQYSIGDAWVPVKSGFNGMAIYDFPKLKDCNYLSDTFKCEHIALHHDMHQKGFSNIFYNPSFVIIVGQQGNSRFQYITNSILKSAIKK